jgi:exodeoxyribonuclease-3
MRYDNWDKAFIEYMGDLEKQKPVVFCGDLNVAHTEDDIARPKENIGNAGFTDEERERFGDMLKGGFVDTFRMFTLGNGYYTWWSNLGGARSRNIGWRIDYFLVSKSLTAKVSEAKILMDHMGSDHCPVTLLIQ